MKERTGVADPDMTSVVEIKRAEVICGEVFPQAMLIHIKEKKL